MGDRRHLPGRARLTGTRAGSLRHSRAAAPRADGPHRRSGPGHPLDGLSGRTLPRTEGART